MIYPIVVYGNPVLKKRARDIEKGEIDVNQLAADMHETMEQADGVGLAAPQIGKSIRMFVIDATKMEDEEVSDFKQIFINPVIIEEKGEEWPFEEGCLSIPEIREDVFRQEELTIKYVDENWEEKEETYSGMKARIIQHEYDHIEGVLFTDHLSSFKKKLLKGKLQNISKGKVKPHYRIKAPLAK
ncbi:MAG: peptide deformylase [Bacteroidota bacterium]